MRAGRLDRKIDIQRKTVTVSPSGAPIETWNNLAANRWAYVAPASGDERFSDPQLAAKQQVEFGIRYSADVADLNPLDRISYGASIYDIHAVHEIGRREGFKIIAVRRADA
jgi:SPP1 family predicted phage head-tail adaptor